LLGEFLDRGETIIRDLLLGNTQESGHVAIGPALDHEQLEHFEPGKVAALPPLTDQPPKRLSDGFAFQFLPFLTAGQAAGGGMLIVLVMQNVAGPFRRRMQRMPARTAKVIGDLVTRDGEEISLKLAGVVKIRQAVEKADESFGRVSLIKRTLQIGSQGIVIEDLAKQRRLVSPCS